jgi:hypothetical protein
MSDLLYTNQSLSSIRNKAPSSWASPGLFPDLSDQDGVFIGDDNPVPGFSIVSGQEQ